MEKLLNISKASKRVKKAIKDNENIILFSDSDLDGVTSLIILEEAIKNLGGNIALRYFPDREKEGYTMSNKAKNAFKKNAPGLMIISDATLIEEEYEEFKKDFDVIVLDHHELVAKPKFTLINPKQDKDPYYLKDLSAATICYKLAEELMPKMSPVLDKLFLELVAISIIADKIQQIEENITLVERGLEGIDFSMRPGMRVVFSRFSIAEGSKFLNTTDMEKSIPLSYLILSAIDEETPKEIIEDIVSRTNEKFKIVGELIREYNDREYNDPYIFDGGEIPYYATAAIAGTMRAKNKKPAFIYSILGTKVRGSIRSPEEINVVDAMDHCKIHLEAYGGHSMAAGFTLKKKDLEKFDTCLGEYFKKL